MYIKRLKKKGCSMSITHQKSPLKKRLPDAAPGSGARDNANHQSKENMMPRKTLLFAIILLFTATAFAMPLFAQTPQPERLMIYQGEKWSAQLYGYVKLDGVYNSSAVFCADAPIFAFSKDTPETSTTTDRDGSLVLTARTSRVGFDIMGPEALGARTHVKIEFDFWGGLPDAGTSVRQAEMRLRLAYVEFLWPTKTYLRAGNDWMLGTTGFCLPDMITFLPCTAAGLLFMREPQVAVGQTIGGDMFNVTIDLSASRAQGNDGGDALNPGPRSSTSQVDNQVDSSGVGEASQQPSYKGRIAFRFAPAQDFLFILGGTGQYMQEVHAVRIAGDGTSSSAIPNDYRQEIVDSWFGQAFASFLFGFIRLQGHYFQGENIDTYFGGIGQGVTKRNEGYEYATIEAVRSQGGWGELWINLRYFQVPLTFSFGAGVEAVDKDTLALASQKTKNSVVWGNFWWYMSPNFKFGVEVARHKTEYLGQADGEDWKVQSAFQYFF